MCDEENNFSECNDLTEYNVLTLENIVQEQFIQKELNLSYPSTIKEPINEFIPNRK